MEAHATIKPRAGCTWSPSERAEWVALFEKSGQSITEFCRDNDLSPIALSAWRTQLGAAAPGAGALVEVPLATLGARPASAAAVTIRLANGTQLEVPCGTDPTWLTGLVGALQSARG